MDGQWGVRDTPGGWEGERQVHRSAGSGLCASLQRCPSLEEAGPTVFACARARLAEKAEV